MACFRSESAFDVFIEFGKIAGGNFGGFENQSIVIVSGCSVDGKVVGTCPDVSCVHNDEFIVHDCRTVVRNNGDSGALQFFHGSHHDVVLIGDEADFNLSGFCIQQSLRDFVQVQIVDADIDGAFCRADKIAESPFDVRRGRKIQFYGRRPRYIDHRRVIETRDIESGFCDDRISCRKQFGMDRFESFWNLFFRNESESRSAGDQQDSNSGEPSFQTPSCGFEIGLFCFTSGVLYGFFCFFSTVCHTDSS